jgi:hypothetical protein
MLLLTLTLATGCSLIKRNNTNKCKIHAYIKQNIREYIASRITVDSPVRMAIIPFTVPANFSPVRAETEGLGFELARKLHSHFLTNDMIPIVEVLARKDWPGKRDEFFTGNHGAIAQAQQAGFQLILVGYVETPRNLETTTLNTKLIDVQSGITIAYIRSHQRREQAHSYFTAGTYHPSQLNLDQSYESILNCTAEKIMEEDALDENQVQGNSFIDLLTQLFESD